MKLHNFPWGLYPRRVIIYLAEKGVVDVELVDIEPHKTEGWPPSFLRALNPAGTLPVLDVGEGTVVRQSLAILEYLEERFPTPDMIGATQAARATTRELIAVIDEATTFFGIWAHKGSRLFAGRETPSAEAAATGAEKYAGKLRLLEAMVAGGPFLAGDAVTIADCVVVALLQFVGEFYGVSLPVDCPKLAAWYERFSRRPSVPHCIYPPELLSFSYGLLEQTLNTSSCSSPPVDLGVCGAVHDAARRDWDDWDSRLG